MKKEELQKAYEEQKKETELWKERFMKLKESSDDSSETRRLRSDLMYQKNLNDMSKTYATIKTQEAARLKEENALLTEDNERLLEDTKMTYRVGIVEREQQLREMLDKQDEWTAYRIKKLEEKNSELEKKVEEQSILISFLKILINDKIFDEDKAGEEIKKAYEQYRIEASKPARSETDLETKKRIRELRRQGFSMRKIAKMEQVSVGVVCKIIHAEEPDQNTEKDVTGI